MVDQPSPLVLPWFIRHWSYNAASTEASASSQQDTSETLTQKGKLKQEKKLTKSSNRSFVKHYLNRRETPQLGLLTLYSEERRNLFLIQKGSRKDLFGFNWWVSFAPEFQCCYFCEPSCLFYLSFNFDFYVSKIIHL